MNPRQHKDMGPPTMASVENGGVLPDRAPSIEYNLIYIDIDEDTTFVSEEPVN